MNRGNSADLQETMAVEPEQVAATEFPGLGPARQANLREVIYDQLKDAFMAGYFAPGDNLNLRELAHRFETSITPVREAVRRLVAEGALVDAPARALRVPSLRRSRLIDLKHARIGIESMVTELAVERAAKEDFDRLEAILDAAAPRVPNSPIDELRSNRLFHFSLYQLSDSPTLLRVVESLWLQYGPFLNLIHYTIDTDIRGTDKDHRRILAAAREGDAAAAKAALVKDISRSFDILDAYTQEADE